MKRRVLAIIGIVLLVQMYLTTLILAIIGTPKAIELLKASIIVTIALPVFLYIWGFMIRILKNKKPLDNSDEIVVFDNKGMSPEYDPAEESNADDTSCESDTEKAL